MTFILQIQVEADSVEDALTKKSEGKTISVLRAPQQPQTVGVGQTRGSQPQSTLPQKT